MVEKFLRLKKVQEAIKKEGVWEHPERFLFLYETDGGEIGKIEVEDKGRDGLLNYELKKALKEAISEASPKAKERLKKILKKIEERERTLKVLSQRELEELIEKYRCPVYAGWTKHEYSDSRAKEPEICSFDEVAEFIASLLNGEEEAYLTIVNIEWEEYGNCIGDDLYPCTIEGYRIPDGRYDVILKYWEPHWGGEQVEYYIFDPNKEDSNKEQ